MRAPDSELDELDDVDVSKFVTAGLMALRSGELTTSATALRELSAVGESIDESRANLQRLIARADALERRLPAMSGGAL